MADTTQVMTCMEVWGGNALVNNSVTMSGLDAWVYSKPFEKAEAGGDVYYVSSCGQHRRRHVRPVQQTLAGNRQIHISARSTNKRSAHCGPRRLSRGTRTVHFTARHESRSKRCFCAHAFALPPDRIHLRAARDRGHLPSLAGPSLVVCLRAVVSGFVACQLDAQLAASA